ncbi:hypothetical protein O181_012085 [Austropuccinia psidii MF-1]|uniref:Uncharacterized protein n=1 Tax=Austropuccinia psidii MF-1 TaxID=1389203 RepID=A0A9Q3BWF1_9BASI|nr:hypothetical protein [Austropuccinia psidii MF-1]
MTNIYKGGQRHTNANGLIGWPFTNFKSNLDCDPEIGVKISIHFMEVDRRKTIRFLEWAQESGTIDSENKESQGKETPILGISSSERHTEFFSALKKFSSKCKQCSILL